MANLNFLSNIPFKCYFYKFTNKKPIKFLSQLKPTKSATIRITLVDYPDAPIFRDTKRAKKYLINWLERKISDEYKQARFL